MFEFKGYDVYAKLDEQSRITAVNSSAFINDYDGWTLIESGVHGDRGHHAQGNYFPDGIFEMNHMIPMYEYVDGKVMKRPDAAIQADIEAIEASIVETPSQLDIIEAQVTYTALMTDTLLEV